jgi:TolB-like protein/tetratricopeptide (TPR) repeat protein
MQLYGQSGRRGAAVEVYRAHDDVLRAELNAKPESETREVFAELANNGRERAGAGIEDATQNADFATQGADDVRREAILQVYDPSLRKKTRTLAWGLAGCLIGVTAISLFQAFVPSTGVQNTALESAAELPSPAADSIAIAVLPFINISGDAAQDFFSDGATEEIISALAKFPGLRVVGRSSTFRFKGDGQDLRAIGRALNAPYLLNGSVRLVGDRVRITAQLVHAEDGISLWTDSYDRELTNILTIQTDIARAIAKTLRLPLTLPRSDTPVLSRKIDISTYEDYLRAKAAFRGRTDSGGVQDVVNLLEMVVQRSPDFAPAWASLAAAYQLIPVYSGTATLSGSANELRQLSSQYAERAQGAAERAVRLDPNLAEGYVALAFIDVSRRDMTRAFDHIAKALSLDPSNADVLAAYRNILLEVGRVEESLAAQQRVVALEPFVPRFRANLATNLWLVGQQGEAIEILSGSRHPDDRSTTARVRLAMIYAAMGSYVDAADTLVSMPTTAFPKAAVDTAVRLLRAAPSAVSLDHLPELGALDFVYLHVGEPSRVLDFYEASIESGYLGIAPLWHKAYAPVRRTERFKRLVQRARLPEFWRAKGWPEFCHPMTGDDFVCD